MKKLKYILLTLCAVVMSACFFSFKTEKVDALTVYTEDDIKVSVKNVTADVKDGIAGHSLTIDLNDAALHFLRNNYMREIFFDILAHLL